MFDLRVGAYDRRDHRSQGIGRLPRRSPPRSAPGLCPSSPIGFALIKEIIVGRRVGLVGCVKEKAAQPLPAKDLYVSTLFRGRRGFVERSCDQWWILSAAHGLINPDAVVAPYDVTLKDAGRSERRIWTQSVLAAIDHQVGLSRGDVVEIHAGSEYRDFGLVDGLEARGCEIVVPTEGMKIGRQLQFYKNALRV